MPNKNFSCLSIQVLDRIGQNEISSDELLSIEKHVSECQCCRELFDSAYSSSQWSEHIRPALTETQMLVPSTSDTEADHQSSVLSLLGPTDDPNMLGRIGNYEIVGVIGQGGMGVVFKALDRSLNRFVAIKMLLPHLAASGAARKRFAREGQAIAAVVDDHVMAIHSVDEWQSIPYLVMTYSRGVSLQKRLNDNGPFEVKEILRIGMQTAKGLAAAHAQGIVHRDIKPSNILLDQNVERVQLVDFGLARAVDDASLTCSGTLAGTPQYMSPEQARAETVDHRSDLFSLGSVLYAMCVGHAPFRAESSYSVLRLIIDKEPRPIRELNPEIPEWLCAIISKLMSKAFDDRYASADSAAILLEQCLAHVQDPVRQALPPVACESDDRGKTDWTIVSKLQRWFLIMNDKRIVSLIALILLLIALLVPWPIATIGNVESAFAFAVPAALLSLGLALLCRSEYFSKIVLWCFGLTIGLTVVGIGVSVPIYMARESRATAVAREAAAVAEMQAAMEAKKQQLKANADTKDSKTKDDQMSNPTDGAGWKKLKESPQRGGIDQEQVSEAIKGNAVNSLGTTTKADEPLLVAIDRFNERINKTYPFHDQPPLTKDELVACASWYGERKQELSTTLKDGITKIAKHYQLPDNWTIVGKYVDMPPDRTPVQAFHIFLQTDSADEQFEIRKRFLSPPKNYSLSPTTTEQDGGVSLASAVNRFNAGHNRADGKKQPPLTEDEVVAAIIHRQTMRDNDDVSDSLFDRLQNIARTRYLPKGATLEVIPTFGAEGGSTYTIWSIRMTMLQDEAGKEGWTYAFTIREQFVSVKHGDAGSIHWGTPAENGLQAGVRLSPPLLSYQFGQKIGVEILYRNVLSKPMPVTLPNFLNYRDYEVEIHDKDGANLDVFDCREREIIGGWRVERIGDEPISLRGRPIQLKPAALLGTTKLFSEAGGQVIFPDPGTSYRLQVTVINYASDTKATLKTGEVEFGVEASVSQVVTVDKEMGVITIKGTKEEVERTKAIINEDKKLKQITEPDSNRNQEASPSVDHDDSLEGVWEGIHYPEGEKSPDEKRLRIVFANNLLAAFSGAQLLWTATFSVEPKNSPKSLFYVVDGKPKRGIFEVKEDGLRLCMADEADAMPTRFGTKHAEFKRLEGAKARDLVDKLVAAVTKTRETEGPVPKNSMYLPFPKELHGNWRIQDATTLTSKRTEYIDQNIFIDQYSLLLTAGDHRNHYRLSHWKHSDDNQSIEADLTAESPSGQDSKTFRCLLEIRGDELQLLRPQNERLNRPESVDDISSSVTRFTMTRESASSGPKVRSPLEAIEIAKRFANADHGKAIRVKFRVASVHLPFVSGGDEDRGHTKAELHLDFRPLPADFAEEQFLVVLTQEAIDRLKKLGIENIEAHFLNKQIEATGRILATTYTARGMPGDHFHLIANDLKQITLVNIEQD